jgi:type II secretory pathway pseudopilin PulG
MTLLETILVVLLLLLLVSGVMFSFTGWRSDVNFDEGLYRFEGLLRMTRADASNQGRRLRITPDAESGEVRVLWEPDPFKTPNEFVEYPGTWTGYVPTGLVRVTRCELTGDSAYRTMDFGPMQNDSSRTLMESVTFQPSGSSDSAVFELSPMDPTDVRRGLMQWDGVNATVSTQVVSSDQTQQTGQ